MSGFLPGFEGFAAPKPSGRLTSPPPRQKPEGIVWKRFEMMDLPAAEEHARAGGIAGARLRPPPLRHLEDAAVLPGREERRARPRARRGDAPALRGRAGLRRELDSAPREPKRVHYDITGFLLAKALVWCEADAAIAAQRSSAP